MKKVNLTESQFEDRDGYQRAVLFSTDDFGVNTKLQLMRIAPAGSIRPHYHKIRTECFRIVSGNGEIKINGESVATTGDDVVICEPGDIHEFINHSDTDFFTFMVIRSNDTGDSDMIWEED